MTGDDVIDGWNARLRATRNLIVALRRETPALRLDRSRRRTGERIDLPAGAQVRYVETFYDAMRLEQAFHEVEVVSGPETGNWLSLLDMVGTGPFPWEEQ